MQMINFIKELQPREIKLILIAAASVVFLLILFTFNNLYSRYDSSLKNLDKAMSDYEYVFERGRVLSEPVSESQIINKSILESIVELKGLTNNISNVETSVNNEQTTVSFNSSDLTSSVNFIEAVLNQIRLNLSSINYINNKSDISVSFILN